MKLSVELGSGELTRRERRGREREGGERGEQGGVLERRRRKVEGKKGKRRKVGSRASLLALF